MRPESVQTIGNRRIEGVEKLENARFHQFLPSHRPNPAPDTSPTRPSSAAC
jgi:hypothetical protein